jgi:gamma-glutamyltranspeptidase/glutathione hydrolase
MKNHIKLVSLIAVLTLTCCQHHKSCMREITWKGSGKGGAVAAGKGPSTAAGIHILEQGGNAADAAVATLIALSVTDFGLFCIGAEIPFIFYDAKTNQVKVLCGLGRAPLDPKAIEWYYANKIPDTPDIKAAPVPGAISLYFKALELYGTMSFEQVVAPTLALLDAGNLPWHKALAKTLRRLIEREKNTDGTREQKLQAARNRFYKGDIADELAMFYKEKGHFLTKKDLEAYETLVEEPVSVNYRGYKVYKCNTWTQGPYLCQTLRLLENFDLKSMGHLSADYIHVCAEALKLALADRDEYYGDPLFVDVPMDKLLSDEYTKLRVPLIDMKKASHEIRPGDPVNMKALSKPGTYRPGPGGTTTCCVADRWGNVVAATPSGNGPYQMCHELGIAFGRRLRCLNTTPGHANSIAPGKRPRITLTPTLVCRDNKPVLAISVAGGDLQDQTTLNLFLNHVEFGMMPADAVNAPRFCTSHHEHSFNPDPDRPQTRGKLGGIRFNYNIAHHVQEELVQRGHEIGTSPLALALPVMIYIDQKTRMFHAAADSSVNKYAAALE